MRRTHRTRLLALGLAITIAPIAFGEPADLTQVAAPSLGSDPPHAQDIGPFDVSVASQTGAATFNFPIRVPPGRGPVPALSLSYTSQGAIYGSPVGAGWSLQVPEIRYDTTRARARYAHYSGTVDPEWEDEPYISTLSGGRPLVAVAGDQLMDGAFATYRAREDSAWIVYQRFHRAEHLNEAGWIAQAPDGTIYTFGEPLAITNEMTSVISTPSLLRVRAPLTTVTDALGNSTKYYWRFASNELLLTSIRYTINPASGVDYFAEVTFNYGTPSFCTVNGQPVGPIAAQTDYRTGIKLVDGASPLTQIVATALDPATHTVEHTRQIDLTYDAAAESCIAAHAPYRQLASIQERAWHTGKPVVVLPATTFQYGNASISLTPHPAPELWNFHGAELIDTNLAWGRRFGGTLGVSWPTVEATLVDFDGDGLVDRLVNSSGDDPEECRVTWWRNMGDGNFVSQSELTLPRLPWGDGHRCAVNFQRTEISNVSEWNAPNGDHCSGPNPLGSYLVYRWIDVTGDGKPELVTAIHADAYFDPSDPNTETPTGEPWPSCSGDQSACPALSSSCMSAVRECPQDQPCWMKQGLVDLCINAAPRVPCGDMIPYMAGGGDDNQTPSGSPQGCPSFDFVRAFKLPCGLYPWTIYRNLGQGVIDFDNPETILQPVPLESDSGDSSVSAGNFWGRQHAIFDFDGDGAADALIRARYYADPVPPPGVPPFWWWGYLGDGNGGFIKDPVTGLHKPFFFQMPQIDDNSLTHSDLVGPPTGLYDLDEVRQTFDWNGDGAPDYMRYSDASGPQLLVHFNDGLGMRAFGTSGDPDMTVTEPLRASTQARVDVADYSGSVDHPFVINSTRDSRIRLVDVDGDGRPDIYRLFNGQNGAEPQVLYNIGGDVAQASDADAGMAPALAQPMSTSSGVDPNGNVWQDLGDLVDLNGDGIPEALSYNVSPVYASYDPAGSPPRLLTHIDNGRGAQTTIAYAPLSDSNVVTNDPSDGSSASPRTEWVVKSVDREDAFEASTGTTTYQYKHPVFNKDPDEGRYSFRGFREVTSIGPAHNATIQRYGFHEADELEAETASPDWSGRLVETVTRLSDTDPASVVSIARQSWTSRSLFQVDPLDPLSAKLVTYHPDVARTYTCSPGQTEAACVLEPAGLTRSDTTLTPLPLGGPTYLLYVESDTTLQDSEGYDDGDRRTHHDFDLYTTGGSWRLRETKVQSFEKVSGSDALYASTETEWDAARLVPLRTKVQLDDSGALAITERTYDMTTGNVLTVCKPVQFDKPTKPLLTQNYDTRKLFVAETINEVGHNNQADHEYGTGAVIEERGPIYQGCEPNCPIDADATRTGQRITVDGLGRPTQIEAVISYYPGNPTAQTFKHSVAELFQYVDAPVGAQPAYVIDQKRIDHADSRFTSVKTELDGHGRPIRTTEETFTTAPSDAVTSFDYDDAGRLVAVSVPDPSANSSAQVTFTYTFDAIGRPIGMRRPDSATPSEQSGIDVSYDGLSEIREEHSGGGGSSTGPAKTILVHDAFGRLVTVRERTVVSPPDDTYVDTTYAYSPSDEVKTIVSATTTSDEVTTQLEHDFAGRRRKITRGTREWNYYYDKNGNLTTEAAPPPTQNAADILAYSTDYIYDDLDRLEQVAPGPREMDDDDDDLELFGATEINYTWDAPQYNRNGHIVYFNTRGPGNTNVFNGQYSYDAEGNIINEERTWHITLPNGAGQVYLPSRGETYRYGAFGRLKTTQMADGAGPTGDPQFESNSSVTTYYDDRGNPLKLRLTRPGLSNQDVAVQTRNVAGLVTKRRTDQPTQAMTFIESNWTYDQLGRVTQQQIVKNGTFPTSRVAEQDLTYFGNDDPATLDHYIGASNHKQFQYTYDLRHQLTHVDETAAGGAFSADYAFGPAGRFTHATVTPTELPGREVRPRNVDYTYLAVDPEAVSSLDTPIGGGLTTPYASYEYDSVGNQTSRSYFTDSALPTPQPTAEQRWDFLYDGQDQLRRVSSPDGTIEEYWYDHQGNRALIRTRPVSGAITWRWFHKNTENEWQTNDLSDTNAVLRHTSSYASLGTPVARIKDRNDRTEFQFHGLADSTLAAVESGVGLLESGESAPTSGTTIAAFVYSPFGEVAETSGDDPASQARSFNDKYRDTASILLYYGVRYYDPVVMSWTQADPALRFSPEIAWEHPRLANLYTAVLQNPLSYKDPDGRAPTGAIVACALDPACVAAAALVTGGVAILNGIASAVGADDDPRDLHEIWRDYAEEAQEIAAQRATAAAAAKAATTQRTDVAIALLGGGLILMGDKVKVTPPDWVKKNGHRPRPEESAQDFAERILNDKYGNGNWRRGPGSEFSKIVKWVNRVLRGRVLDQDKPQNSGDEQRKKRHMPADLNHDGKVEQNEELAWMWLINNDVPQ